MGESLRVETGGERRVTVYEPNHRLAYQNDGMPFPVEITYRFAAVPNGNGTRLTATAEVQLSGIYTVAALLFSVLLPTLIERIIRNIKHVLEAQPLGC